MKDSRIRRTCRTMLLAAAPAAISLSVSVSLPVACAAQATPSGTAAPGPSRLDIFGGYSYLRPVNSDIYNHEYEPINTGALVNVTGYFTKHFGVQAEGEFSPHGPNDCVYTAQAGVVYRTQIGSFFPFAHLLGGGARVGGPIVQPCTWGYGFTGGLGVDYVLPNSIFHNHLAVRPIQADFVYADVDFGARTAPTFLNGGVGQVTAMRLSAGIVYRLGDMQPSRPATYGCEVQPVSVYQGDPITVTGKVINLEVSKKLTPIYTWSVTGGKITGTTETATIETAGLAAGDYNVVGHVREGFRRTQHADCDASFRVLGYDPPTIAC